MRTILIIGFVCSLLAGASCGTTRDGSSDGKLEVVASFYPLEEAARQVGGDRVEVTNLTAPGAEPHDLELTPDQIQSIATAKVVLFLGGGFQPAVDDALRDATGLTIDVSANLRTLPVPQGESGSGLAADPHVWLDPVLYRQIVVETEQALEHADPGDASFFHSNADAFEERVSSLDTDFRHGLASCSRNVIVTSHAAFGYLAQRYGLVQVAISGLDPDAEPSANWLAALGDQVRADGVTTIFTETLVSPKVAQTLAEETGTITAVLDPLESLTPQEAAAGADYGSVMRQNLETLRVALGCS
ncbi:MAG: zinc ABC transporter substrate-binding protein [Actinomycetota bacterium]|nr:zinc ABC transporter substrate-binding protein [Actinomycetota bacterium]